MGSIPAHTSLAGDVREGAVTVVVVQDVLAPVGDEQILKSVVVIIADANSGSPTGADETRFCSYVGERAVAIVLVQPVGRIGRGVLEARSAENE